MIKLTRPTLDAGTVYTTCNSRVRDLGLKTRLTNITADIVNASAEFDRAAAGNLLHQIVRQELIGGQVTSDEMAAVYTDRMAKVGAPGRGYYDSILGLSPSGKCPLCVHREVSTLDHHLPKSHFPALAVAPLNLIPACSDCNKTKLQHLPANAGEETLHPYYDDVDDERWLFAMVIEKNPPALLFSVQPPANWSQLLGERVRTHFKAFRLGSLYSAQAAEELINIKQQLQGLLRAGGARLVREELIGRADSAEAARRNGWRTATFHALAENDWYCAHGCLE